MNILITAGGTSERIDDVRRITNNSTGRLGVEIAHAFPQGHKIFYVMGKNSTRPNMDVIEVEGVADLQAALKKILSENKIDIIIHAMAVSDFWVKDAVQGKISSDADEITITLTKAPKVIAMFRGLAPDAVIVGFKLVSGMTPQQLVDTGHALLEKYDCDYVLANDVSQLNPSDHKGWLIDRDKNFEIFAGKAAIAEAIVGRVLKNE